MPVALAGDGDDEGVGREAIEGRRDGGCVRQEFSPALGRAGAGHEGGFVLVATHDDLEEMLAGMFGQLREPDVIDDEQIGLEGMGEGFVPLLQGLLRTEVGDDIKGGAVARHAALLDGFVADNVGERRGTHAGRNEEEPLGAFAKEVAGRHLVDVLPRSDAVRPPVKFLPRFESGELGRAGAQLAALLMTPVDLGREDEFPELPLAEPVGAGLRPSDFRGGAHIGEFELS